MKKKMLIGQILILSMMPFLSSSAANTNLECYTDYIDVLTCIWNTSSVEDTFLIKPTTKCFLQGHCESCRYIQISQCNLEPLGSSQSKLRKGTLKFKRLSAAYLHVLLHVQCENITVPVEPIKFVPCENVKLNPPEQPLVIGQNVTWKSNHSRKIHMVKYEVQWGLLENSWEKNQVASTSMMYCELPEETLILGRQYVVRVRSKPESHGEFWSEWSPVTQWTSTVGSQPSPEYDDSGILGVFANLTSIITLTIVAVFLLAFFCILQYRRKMKCLYVPTPGKYFGNLFSDHGGDFKSWLGPFVNPDMFIKVDSEFISHLTIYKASSSEMLSNMNEKEVSLMDSSTSSFSNSTYFLSQSSKGAGVSGQLEPCSADCPYGPARGSSVEEKMLPAIRHNGHDNELSEEGMITPLETSSSYKQLQKLRLEIQSPDSGFAGSSEEQESQEESGSEGLPSPPVVDNSLPINCILPCPVPQLMGFSHLGIPSGLAWSPWNNQLLQNLPPVTSTNVLIGNSGIMACSGILEPSGDDYMPVKKIQG